METSKNVRKHIGSCHCGAIRFEVEADMDAGATACNCTICTKINQVSSCVKPNAFTLISGQSDLSEYAWGGKTATRFFCRHCGVHCFGRGYLEQLGGDYVSVNYNCLDEVDPASLKVMHFDGRHDNWMAGPRSARWPHQVA